MEFISPREARRGTRPLSACRRSSRALRASVQRVTERYTAALCPPDPLHCPARPALAAQLSPRLDLASSSSPARQHRPTHRQSSVLPGISHYIVGASSLAQSERASGRRPLAPSPLPHRPHGRSLLQARGACPLHSPSGLLGTQLLTLYRCPSRRSTSRVPSTSGTSISCGPSARAHSAKCVLRATILRLRWTRRRSRRERLDQPSSTARARMRARRRQALDST